MLLLPFSPPHVSDAIFGLLHAHPEFQISLIEEDGASLKKKILNKEIDAAFIVTHPSDKGHLEYTQIFDDEIVIYMKPENILNHPDKNYVTFKEINSQELCTLDDIFLIEQFITDHFTAHKFFPNYKIKSSSVEFLMKYCTRFNALDILPASIFLQLPDKDAFTYKSMLPSLHITTYMCYDKDNENKVAPIKDTLLNIKKNL